MTRLTIIHTSPATLEPLKALAGELLPAVEVTNILDDSILPQLARNGGDVNQVADRLIQYARFAEQAGADVILNACSSVGEVVARMQSSVQVPVVRVDEALAEAAVARGITIGVAATLATTLNPTTRLLEAKAKEAGKSVALQPLLIASAYERLMMGDKEGHDNLLVEALAGLARSTDVVVLAQASMARVLPRLPEVERGKVLSSPRLGMQRVRQVLAAHASAD
jgi:aspartate/glutamate racemase